LLGIRNFEGKFRSKSIYETINTLCRMCQFWIGAIQIYINHERCFIPI